MSPEILTLLMFGILMSLVLLGTPIFLALGFVGVAFSLVTFGFPGITVIGYIIYKQFTSLTLLACVLFFFMATVLRRSGIADTLYEALHHWLGGLRGGLASGTILVCTIFAAMVGISGAATVSMGLVAIPAMLNRGYNKSIALGCVAAGGVLGIIIPPSVIMILYSFIVGTSVVRLYFAGFLPGIMIAVLHVIYITVRSNLQPHLGPAIPPKERISLVEKLYLLKYLVMPVLVVLLVLGGIYAGICTPTEAGAVGSVGAMLCAVFYRKLNFKMLKAASLDAFKLSAMGLWIVAAASVFNATYMATGARETIEGLVYGLNVNPWVVIIIMQLSLFFFGFIMDDYALVMLLAPIYHPIAVSLGFDPIWWGMIFLLNIQMAYLTPPYGFNLFYLRGVIPQIRSQIPEDITMQDIYRSVFPFVGLQMLGLILTMIFPLIALWLPGTIG